MRIVCEREAAAESRTAARNEEGELPENQEDRNEEAGREKNGESSGGQDIEAEGVRLSAVMDMITDYIQSHYMEDLSMQDLARRMNYSEAYFCKLFKQCFGQNFTSYLTEYRVETAKKMLGQPTVNVKEIGKAVGYCDANYFAKVFKRITGQSPTDYRTELLLKKAGF